MYRKKVESLGDIIDSWLKKQGGHSRVYKASVINNWDKYVGKTAARYTESVKFEDQELIVTLKSAVARRELELIKTAIIDRINEDAGEKIVRNIYFNS